MATALSESDWNFDAVPDSELVACCYWEYARESEFIVSTLQRYRKKWYCAGGELNAEIRKLWDDVGRIQSIGHAADVVIRGCCYEPDKVWQSEDRDKPNYRHPHAPPLTGSFPAPWQSLGADERKYRSHIRTDVEQLQIVPIKLSHWGWAKEIAKECQHQFDERQTQRKEWEKKYLRRDDKGNFYLLPGTVAPASGQEIRPRTRWGVGETLIVDIAWDCFTNDEIANYFRKWVRCARPENQPAPDNKGRNKARDWRVALERLGMLRLLHQFQLSEVADAYPDGWKLYRKREWYKERKRAREMFHKLFPFLAESECPLSWSTRGGRSR